MYQLGFIGTGNMAGALVEAACKTVDPAAILLTNRTAAKAEVLAQRLGCQVTTSNSQVAQNAKWIFLGVKPQMMAGVLKEIAPVLAARKDRFILVSMAAGLRLETLAQMVGENYPILRIMPNTPAAIGEGMIFYTPNHQMTEEEIQDFCTILAAGGLLDRLPEPMLDSGTAVAGCGGAFCSLFLEALADGGVACGLPRQKALLYAAQMVIGTAKLMLETGKHPGALKDEVCSPAGSTIQGVRALERGGFRSATFEAVVAAYEKTKALGD